MKPANNSRPSTSAPLTPGLDQPRIGCSISPNEIPARPLAASAAPAQSIDLSLAVCARPGTAIRDRASAAITSGRLITKIPRHETESTIWPPSTGPARIPIPPHAVHLPIAAPRSSFGNTATMIASAAGVSSALETPCRARAAISTPTVGAAAHSADPTPKPATPATNTRRSPSLSVNEPASRISELSVSR